MRLLVVNPNTTASMTAKIGAAARAVAGPGTEIVAVNPANGLPSIEGYFDEVFAVPGLITEMRKYPDVDATIIACFDDTGLDAARSFSPAPVIGIGEAAFHLASLIAGKFTAVTTLARSVPAIEHNLIRYGLASRCARVRAADVAVLELEVPGSAARGRISQGTSTNRNALRCSTTSVSISGYSSGKLLLKTWSAARFTPTNPEVGSRTGLPRIGRSTRRKNRIPRPRRKLDGSNSPFMNREPMTISQPEERSAA